MEVLDHKDYIFIPEHTYNIYGVPELLDFFCKENKLKYIIYSLKELKQSLQYNKLSNELIKLKNYNILLFIVPVSIPIDQKIYNLFNKNIISFATPSTGIDHVDYSFLKEHTIPFFDAQGENRDSVVEYVLSTLPYFNIEQKLLKKELTLGIIGFGRIGSLLAKILKYLGFKFIAIDPYVLSEEYNRNLSRIQECDIISFHVPLTKSGQFPTYEIIDKIYIDKILPQQIIINTSRGKIFSPVSYNKIINQNICAFDVYYEEPPEENLLKSEKLKIATPHVAGYNWISRFRGFYRVLEKFAGYFNFKFHYDINDFKPSYYEIEIFDSILKETILLKRDIRYFYIRDNYPIRANIKEQKYNKHWHFFHKLLYEFFIEFDS
ncbi:MAG: hypothetical protein KatS3mg129_2402 [Leptospiraceae bacterium]|nr:MAG: hypothetical protein KatS3mg129_2402 [Leptospiraceae bacterium]